MSRSLVISVVLSLTSHSVWAEETDPTETAWQLFNTHCTACLEADTVSDVTAAFAPPETKLYTIADGALQNGTDVIEDLPISGARYALFNISTIRLDGGVMRNCTLQIPGADADL